MSNKTKPIIIAAAVVTSLFMTNLLPAAAYAENTVVSEKAESDQKVAIAIEKLNQPWGLAADLNGALIVVSAGNHGISKWENGKLSVVTGLESSGYVDGPITAVHFNNPTYTAVDSKGTIYVADADNHVVRKITSSRVYTAAGTGSEGYVDGEQSEAQFHGPTGLAIDKNDNVYVADTLNHVIRRVTPEGEVSTFAGIAGETGGYQDGNADTALFNEPMGLVFDENGGLYVADSGNHLIRYIYEGSVTTIAGSPTEVDTLTGYMTGGYKNGEVDEALFNRPRGLAYEQGVLFVADSLNYRIRAVQPEGRVITIAGQSTPGNEVGAAEDAQFNQPSDLLYQAGKLYVSDTLNHNVKVLEINPGALKPVRNEADLLAGTQFQPATEDIQVWMDGKQVAFSLEKMVYRSEEQTYIPVRILFEAWGAEVSWDAESQTVLIVKDDWNLELSPNVDQGVLLQQGTTYVEVSRLEKETSFLMAYTEEYNAFVIDSGQ